MYMAVIGIDIGTTGTKCTVFDSNYKIRGYAYQEYNLVKRKLNDGFQGEIYEIDMHIVLNAVNQVLKKATQRYGGSDVSTICATSFGETFVLLDEEDHILGNSMIYMDCRGQDEARQFEAHFGADKIARVTGILPHSMYSACKLMWLAKHRKEIFKKVKKLCFVADYVLYTLGAEHFTDYSLASRTMAFDVFHKEWWQEMLDYIGIKKSVLPGTVPAGTPIGTMRPDVGAVLGLPGNVTLVIGGQDQIAAALGGGVLEAGKSINGIGTVDCITTAFGKLDDFSCLTQARYATIPYPVNDLYVTYAFNMTGGSLLEWFKQTFVEDLAKTMAESEKSIYKLLDETLYPEPTELLVLPHFVGAGTPTMDNQSRGAIVGLTFNTTKEQIYRSMLEGETFEMKHNLTLLEEAGVRTDQLRTVGGGSKSPAWMQIRADIMNKPIMVLQVGEAGTLGGAIMAGTAVGDFPCFQAAAQELVKVVRTYEPASRNVAIYAEHYQKYRKLYKNIKEVLYETL
jgi:xylulokinase